MALKLKNTQKITKVLNVFRNDLRRDAYEWFKFYFLLFSGIALIRLLVFIIVLLLAGIFGMIISFGASRDPKVPFSPIRTKLATGVSALARIMLFSLGFHCITIDNREKDKNISNICVVGPHTGLMDSFFITWYFLPSPVSKLEVRSIPIFGSLCVALQTIFVDRKDAHTGPHSRKACIDNINLRSKKSSGFPRVVLFPEGTTTNGKALMEFKKGAFIPGEPVTPVLLTYTNKYYSPAAVGENESNMSVVRCLFQFDNNISATILDAYVPNEEEKRDPELYARNVRDLMAKEMEMPTTEHSYPDLFLQVEMIDKHKHVFVEHDFTLKDVKAKTGLELDDLKVILGRFLAINKDKTGSISLPEFNALGVCDEVVGEGGTKWVNYRERLFDFFVGGEGPIQYRDFLEMMILTEEGGKGRIEDVVNYGWLLFDTEMNGSAAIEGMLKMFADKEDLFKGLDGDKDGKLSYDEWKAACEKSSEIGDLLMGKLADKMGISVSSVKCQRKDAGSGVPAVETTPLKESADGGVGTEAVKIELGK